MEKSARHRIVIYVDITGTLTELLLASHYNKSLFYWLVNWLVMKKVSHRFKDGLSQGGVRGDLDQCPPCFAVTGVSQNIPNVFFHRDMLLIKVCVVLWSFHDLSSEIYVVSVVNLYSQVTIRVVHRGLDIFDTYLSHKNDKIICKNVFHIEILKRFTRKYSTV